MSLDKLVDEVLEQARQEAEKIVLDSKTEARKIISEAEKKANEISKAFDEKNSVLVSEMERKELSAAKLRANKDFFGARKEILNEINVLALEKISKISGEKRTQLLKRLGEKALKELDGAEFFYSNEKDKPIIQKFFPKLKFAGIIPSVGGIILENSQKNIRVNYTFEVLFDSIKGEYLNEIASRVF